MSLFGSLMGDFEDDPFFGAHMRSMRQMNNMMNSMFANSFGGVGLMSPPRMVPPAITGTHMRGSQDIMPFGFPNMNRMFQGFTIPPEQSLVAPAGGGSYVLQEELGNNPNCHSYSSSTVMTMSSGPDGRPQVYQASSSTRTAPGGVKETKKSVCDSRTGTKKLAVGHHIGDRAHVLEREQNVHSGEREERQEFINLEEEEADDFNHEFEHKTRQSLGALSYPSSRHARRQREATNLALPPSSSSRTKSRGYNVHNRRSYPALPAPSSPSAAQQERAKKRDHEPDSERTHKAMKPSHETSM